MTNQLPCLDCLEAVIAVVQPMAPGMTDRDIADLILTVHRNPLDGPELLDSYRAANPSTPSSVWGSVWDVVKEAANVAGIITEIAGAIALIP